MRGRHPWLNRALGQILALALVVPIGLIASISPAKADPPAYEAPLKQVIKQTSDWAAAGLSRVGALAQPLPLLGISPGSLVDADRLIETASNALRDFGLVNDNRDLGNGARLFSSVTPQDDGGTLLDLTLTTRHQVNGKDFGAAGITAAEAVSITGWTILRLKAKYLNGEVFLVSDNFAPRLDVDAVAHFGADLSAAKASVGILEVALLTGSTLTATTHLLARVTDGNNDGKLSFGSGGELAAPGSLNGLVQIGLDTSGGGKVSDDQEEAGPGSIDATMKLGAATQGAPVDLPSFEATVRVTWPNIGTGTPNVQTTGLDGTIAKFRNMTALDIAAGLAQLATLLSGVQQSGGAGNLDLPFLRGTFADAVRINEKVLSFLKKYVHPKPEDENFVPGVDDPALAGQPKFASIQEFIKLLQAEGLLANTPVTFANEKLAFSISLSRSPPATEIPLDSGAASVSGQGATFTPDGFSVSGNRFQPGTLKGQRVVAGTSAGVVKDNTANTVTLEAEWIGGRPSDDSSWVISSSDPHIGAVQLGGVFTQTTDEDKKIGLKVGNAQASFAKVKPSYNSFLTLVLDLRDNLGSPEANADRVLLRTATDTPLFTANFPISSQIDFMAKVGFLKVQVNGSLTVTPDTEGADMLKVKFKTAQDISLGNLFKQLKDNPAGLFDVSHSVRTQGQARLSVPGDTGSLGEGVGATFSWVAGSEPTVDVEGLEGLFALDFNADDPNALFGIVVEALRAINKALADSNGGSGIMDQEIPFVGKSARELLGSDESGVGGKVTYTADGANFTLKDSSRVDDSVFTSKLIDRTVIIGTKAYRILNLVDPQTLLIAGGGSPAPENGAAYAVRPELVEAVDRLLANPPETLQDALDMVNKAIGEGSGLSFALDQREGGPFLRIGLSWKRTFHTATPINFDWQGAGDLISLDSSGALSLDIIGDAQLGLLLPLRLTNFTPLLDHTSSASVTVKAAATNVALAARVGPLALEIGKDPDFAQVQANLKFALAGSSDEDRPVFDGLLGLGPQLTTEGTDCTNGVGGPQVPLCARAPIFLNDCDPPAGSNVLSFQLDMSFTPSTTLPDLGPCLQSLLLKLTDFNVGIDGYLAKLEEALRLASFDGKLPLVGDDLQQGQRFIHQLREDIKAAIGPTLANAPATSDGLDDALTFALQQLDPGLNVEVACLNASPCPFAEIKSVRIQLTKAQGQPTIAEGCAADECLNLDVPLDLGLPGLSVKAKQGDNSGVHVKFGWKLHLDMVLDRTEGFYIATHSGSDLTPELAIGASFDTDDLEAQLAFIRVTAEKQSQTPLARAYFAIDLKGSETEESCFNPTPCTADPNAKLTLAEFADLGSLIKTRVDATIAIDWRLKAGLEAAGSALPGISVRFKLNWGVSNESGSLEAGNLDIKFEDIRLEAGAFFQQILKPVLDKLKAVTGPLQPVIDTLYAPIPVLSDLSKAAGGPDITLIFLARTFSTLAGGPDLTFVDTVRAVIDFINRVPNCTNECSIPLGAFNIDPGKALDTAASPQSAASLITNPQPVSSAAVKSAIDAASNGEKLFDESTDGKSNAAKLGFQFPIFDNPASLFGLLLGQDVELVSFDSGPLTLGFSWRQSFGPVYAPPPVMVTLSGSASVSARFIAGLDTKGIRHAIEAVTNGTRVDAVGLLDGLYFKTADSTGKAVPVVTLTGEIAAGAEVSVVFLKVGIEGGIRLTVGFSWNDPNNDGKFRTSEFIEALLINPICLFTTSGQLSVFLRVYITIDLFLFSKKWSFTLVNAVLLDFRAQPDCDPPPPELGGTVDDTLIVFAGKFGQEGQRGHRVWDNTKDTYQGDVFKIYAIHWADDDPDFDGFVVDALGRKQEFLNPNLHRVVVDGRGYSPGGADTAMSLIFLGDGSPDGDPAKTSSFDQTAVVIGSAKADNIRTGTGPSYVDGGGGDDVIVTANGVVNGAGVTAHVTGGDGNDSITTGEGTSTVAGDSTLFKTDKTVNVSGGKTLTGVVDWNDLATPSSDPDTGSGADSITVGHGANFLYGNAGDDTLAALVDDAKSNGANVMVGGLGTDTINGGNGNDQIYTYSQNVSSDVDSAGTGDAGLANNVDTGGGQDEVWGSAGVDLVVSHSANGQTGKIYGYGANDVLIGGYGTDQIFGGPGEDYVIAEPSNVEAENGTDGFGPFRPVTHLPLPGGVQSQNKLLVGGLGSDHIIGGDGGATIFGDKHLVAEECADNTSFVQATPADQGAADLILGGAGVDVVSAGSGNDRTDLGNGNDRACGQIGEDTLRLGGDADKAWGGDGIDQIFGDSGADFAYGNEGNDGVYGGGDNDVLEGNNGTDNVFGGDDNDVLYGGTRSAGLADAGDFLYGEGGSDKILGDNGSDAPYPFDLDGSVPTAGGADVISGGPQNDLAYGGLANDTIAGNDHDDYLEGNNGTDTVNGNTGDDQVIGGSSEEASAGVGRPDNGDFLFGDEDEDLITGDNARFTAGPVTRLLQGRDVPQVQITLLDLGLNPSFGTSGADLVSGGASTDVLLGQSGTDRVQGNAGMDYAEGGPGSDWVEGNAGDDDLVGGSYVGTTTGQPDAADMLFGGEHSDVILGDNGSILRLIAGDQPTPATVRLAANGSVFTARIIVLLDKGSADVNRSGDDRVSGGAGVDLGYGQDGNDVMTGDGDADYLEGNGGGDTLRGDAALNSSVPAQPWPGVAGDLGPSTPDGQDDLIGGSTAQAFRDNGDTIEGNGADDVILGDNGSLIRTIVPGGVPKEKVYSERYATGADLTNATVSRTHDPALPGPSTRFCTTAQATCEPVGAYGNDTLNGNAGNDGIWGQDGDDTAFGGDGDDDIFGELGADTLSGEAGRDAVLGDRGGVVNQFLNADDVAALTFTVSISGVPQETYTGFRLGYYDRRVDLLHDVDGDAWIGSSTSPAMPHNGIAEGGSDLIRGGSGEDNLHGGFGDDLVNGDSGGDQVFGGSGDDVLWGGKGCDPVLNATDPQCLTNGVFDATRRGDQDRMVDHVFGGANGSASPTSLGSDLLDWKPRSAFSTCVPGRVPQTIGGVTFDPCVWFEMTDMTNGTDADNQHHQGTDWLYGGWDRDALQGDVAANGPNPGDRLIDWNGSYNLYTHCNAANGGYNDIRMQSPSMQQFMTKLGWGSGLGRSATDVTTAGTSAFLELAYTYMADISAHGSGSAYPTTPGHFDDPTSCTD